MDEAGKLHFIMKDGGHMSVQEEWFKEEIVRQFL